MGLRLVFLDVDGVLNSRQFLILRSKDKKSGFSLDMLDPVAVNRLNNLLVATEAKVVLSSVWRFNGSQEMLASTLQNGGFRGELIGMTPALHEVADGLRRGAEIQAWMDGCEEEIESFVILDDDSDMGPLLPKLVKTTFELGLQDEHVAKAAKMLVGDTDADSRAGA